MIEVSPPRSGAVVKYTKGSQWARGYAFVTNDRITTRIETSGGRACFIAKVKINSTYSYDEIEQGSRVFGALTESGDGFYPSAWGVSELSVFADIELDPDKVLTLYHRVDNTAVSVAYGRTTKSIADQRINFNDIRYNSGLLIAPSLTGMKLDFMLVPTTKSVPISAPIIIGVEDQARATKIVLGLQAFVGDGLYNIWSGKRDDSVARDGEVLSAGTVMTISTL